jgi:hypothetical protein
MSIVYLSGSMKPIPLRQALHFRLSGGCFH